MESEKEEVPVVDNAWKEDVSYLRSYFEKLEKKEVDSATTTTTALETDAELLKEIRVISSNSQGILNANVCVFIGIGLVIGVLCAVIVSNYFKH